MRKRMLPTLLLALLAVLSASAWTGAAEPDIMVRATFKPVPKLLEAADSFVAAATADTKYAVPAGVVPMLVNMYLNPVPFDALRPDGSIRLFYARGQEFGEFMALVFPAESFDGLLEALRQRKWTVTEGEKDSFPVAGVRVMIVSPAQVNQRLYLVDLGGGAVGCGSDEYSLARLFFGADGKPMLPPAYAGDAPIAVEVETANALKKITPEMLRIGIDKMEQDALKKLPPPMPEFSINPEPIKGFFAMLQEYAPAWLGEAAACRSLLLELRFDADNLRATLTLDAPADSAVGKFAAMASAAPNVENALAENIGPGAFSLSLVADPKAFAPELAKTAPAAVGKALGMMFPALAKNLETQTASAFTLNSGSVMASYDMGMGERQYNIGWVKTPDAKALMDQSIEGVRLFSAALETLIPGSNKMLRLESSPVKTEQGECTVFQLVLVQDSPLAAFLEEQGSGVNAALLEQLQQPFCYMGIKDGVLVSATGQGVQVEEYFDSAVASLDGVETSLIKTPAAVAALEKLSHRQIFTTLMDVDLLFPLLTRSILTVMNDNEPMGSEMQAAFEKTVADLQYTDQILGVAVGGANNRLQGEAYISTKGINTIILGVGFLMDNLNAPPVQGGQEDEADTQPEASAEEGGEESQPNSGK